MCAYMSMSGSSRSTAFAASDGAAAMNTATRSGRRKRIVMSGLENRFARVDGPNRSLRERLCLTLVCTTFALTLGRFNGAVPKKDHPLPRCVGKSWAFTARPASKKTAASARGADGGRVGTHHRAQVRNEVWELGVDSLFEHDLFQKPVSTFWDHAPRTAAARPSP